MQKKLINYKNIPIEEWSKLLNIKWSFDLENQVYSPHRKEEYYEKGTRFIAGWVNMQKFFHSIPKLHQLRGDNIWKYRDSDKINKAIEFWKKGGKMTPPLIDTLYNCPSLSSFKIEDCIVMRAGFHRFSVCCLVELDEIPFFTQEKSQKDIETKLKTVRWI